MSTAQHTHSDSGATGADGRRHPVRARRSKAVARRRRDDHCGGAVSLLVLLMVPVCVLAAVAAAAVPKRFAARSAADTAAGNLATLAAGWRDAQGRDYDAVGWFFPDCGPPTARPQQPTEDRDEPAGPSSRPEPDDGGPDASPSQAADRDGPEAPSGDLRRACETLTRSLLAGLSARGFDSDTLAGYYSSAYTTASPAPNSGKHPASLPCHAGGGTVVGDATYLAITAEWATTDWAAAQVWPVGITIAAEALGRIATHDPAAAGTAPPCGELLSLTTPGGRPRLDDEARSIAASLPTNTPFASR